MNPEPAPPSSEQLFSLRTGIEQLSADLINLAPALIEQHLDMSDPRNQAFCDDPDSALHHEPRWHQFGIVTHCQRAEWFYRAIVPSLLEDWGVNEQVVLALDELIDGQPKRDLLRAALLTHDLGKFSGRKANADGRFSFRGHERASGEAIRSPLMAGYLTARGFSPVHIEYLARCAELHYELGHVHTYAKQREDGYTADFARSPLSIALAEDVLTANPEFALEIGLLFLADNLSKVELDGPVAAVAQLPVNVALAQTYLEAYAGVRRN